MTAARAASLLLGLTFLLPRSVAAQATGATVSAYATVLAGSLNVRDAPSLNGRVVGSVSRSEKLCVIRYEGDWAEVLTPVLPGGASSRRRGFVSRGFISETRADPATLEQVGCRPPPARGGAG